MSESRPNKLTPDMALLIGRKIATTLARGGLIEDSDIESSAADIAKRGRIYQDGYELAKTLDSYDGWNCDLQMAEELDAFSNFASSAIDGAQKEWAARNNIVSPYPLRSRVSLLSGGLGTIDRVYEYGAAKYAIIEDGDTNPTRRLIVNFEDVTPIEVSEIAVAQS